MSDVRKVWWCARHDIGDGEDPKYCMEVGRGGKTCRMVERWLVDPEGLPTVTVVRYDKQFDDGPEESFVLDENLTNVGAGEYLLVRVPGLAD